MSMSIKTRIEPELKHQAVLNQGLPFAVTLPTPNATTQKAIADSLAGRVQRAESVDALFDELGKD